MQPIKLHLAMKPALAVHMKANIKSAKDCLYRGRMWQETNGNLKQLPKHVSLLQRLKRLKSVSQFVSDYSCHWTEDLILM